MSKLKSSGRKHGPSRSATGISIRGKTISHPIPIHDDDEFPIRTPGAGIATPLGSDFFDVKVLYRKSASHSLESSYPEQTGIAISDFGDQRTLHQARSTTDPSIKDPSRRTNDVGALRNSTISISNGGSANKPERKKSGIRKAFRKIFGKKKESISSIIEAKPAAATRSVQHANDGNALRIHNGTPRLRPKRSASMPINEFNRALRSHSIVAEDLLHRYSGSDTKRDSTQNTGDKGGRPRRATTPSSLWSPNKVVTYTDFTGLSPRPASSHPKRIVSAGEAATKIGTAISTGAWQPRRRSRSLGELRNNTGERLIVRRRSDEIKYWRESYEPDLTSPISSHKVEADETILVDDENKENEVPLEKPQPFDFGPLSELAGMKITQAASLETRVEQLEERMHAAERALHPAEHPSEVSGERSRAGEHPETETVNDQSSSSHSASNDLKDSLPRSARSREPLQHNPNFSFDFGSSRISHPFIQPTGDPSNPSSDVPSSAMTVESEKTSRPLSMQTTIRGVPSALPAVSRDEVLTAEHLIALTNMIHAEQAARQELENQVRSLQQQLQALRSSAPTSFPTPDSDRSNNLSHRPRPCSSSEVDEDSSEDEGHLGHQEVFQTPREETGHFGEDLFGHIDGGDLEEEQGAPRTLSLSQITLTKDGQHILKF